MVKFILSLWCKQIKIAQDPHVFIVAILRQLGTKSSPYFEEVKLLLSDYIPKYFSVEKIQLMLSRTIKIAHEPNKMQSLLQILSYLWIPIMNNFFKRGKLDDLIDEAFFEKIIWLFFYDKDPRKGIAYYVLDFHETKYSLFLLQKDDILIEIAKIFSMCCKGQNETNLKMLSGFYWKSLLRNVTPEVKHWSYYILSEISPHMPDSNSKEIYLGLLDTLSGEEEEDSKVLLNKSIEKVFDRLRTT